MTNNDTTARTANRTAAAALLLRASEMLLLCDGGDEATNRKLSESVAADTAELLQWLLEDASPADAASWHDYHLEAGTYLEASPAESISAAAGTMTFHTEHGTYSLQPDGDGTGGYHLLDADGACIGGASDHGDHVTVWTGMVSSSAVVRPSATGTRRALAQAMLKVAIALDY